MISKKGLIIYGVGFTTSIALMVVFGIWMYKAYNYCDLCEYKYTICVVTAGHYDMNDNRYHIDILYATSNSPWNITKHLTTNSSDEYYHWIDTVGEFRTCLYDENDRE